MKLKKYLTTKVFILIVVNLFNFANSSQILTNNDFAPEEGADLELDDPWLRAQKYEQNVLVMEEKIKYLSETFDQLELKMHTLIKDNMELLEKNLQQIIDEKITNINQVAEEKMKIINNAKLTYNVNEVKCSNNRLPKSCQDLNECNSNIYSIMVPDISNKPLPAVCDLKTFDGGWTVIQRRQDGSENFFRNWTDYVEGFGNLNGEFFIGLEKLYALTSLDEPQELYITLEDFDGQERYAKYGLFKVDSNSTDYILTVGKYSGNAGDCLSQHNGYKFSTQDRDNDAEENKNCADHWKGAWWYNNCFYSNLNGLYLGGKTPPSKRGISWCKFRKYEYSLKSVKMMIRSKRN